MDVLTGASTSPVNHLWSFGISFIAVYILYYSTEAIYNAFFGPLSKFPGPKTRALSSWPRIISLWVGNERTVLPALHDKYGEIIRVAPNELSMNGGAVAWKGIHGFKKHGQNHVYKDPAFYVRPYNNVANMIVADDANHARQRKAVSHAFADKTLKDLEPLLMQWASTMRTKLIERAGEPVDMVRYLNYTTFDIMADLCFNESLHLLEKDEYSSWVAAIFGGIKRGAQIRAVRMSSWLGDFLVRKFVLQTSTFRQKTALHFGHVTEKVNRRLERTPEQPDLWSKILEKSDGPDGLSLEEQYSTASLFMVAGTETTATALSGVIYYLLRNPTYLKKVAQEIRESHASHEDLTLESMARLKYLHAVLQEGLRCYPPVPSGLKRRTPKGGVVVCGDVFIPEEMTVSVHQLATYRNEKLFKNPYEFRPERWLGDPEYKDDQLDAVEPFSTGPRNCLGKNLAWHEMRLLLCTTLLTFDLELCEESEHWADQKIFLLWEKTPLMCKLKLAER